MTVLEQVYASGGDVIVSTLELNCPVWAEAVRFCQGFRDFVATTEGGQLVTFQASGIEVALPRRSNNGSESLTFAIDNVTGESQQLIDAALEAEADVTLIFRQYLASDPSAPAERPYTMKILGGQTRGSTVQLQAGFFDMINTAWPRDLYTSKFAPGITYL